jgi:hypothetical protein
VRLATALAAGLTAALTAGCDPGTRDLGPFEIRLALDPGRGCTPSCDEYGMSCGAVLLYRILDLDRPVADGDPPVVHASRCVVVPPADDACGLGALDEAFGGIPPHRIRIEIAAWQPEILGGGALPTCPDPAAIFEPDGALKEDADPIPAFAGSGTFDVGGDESVALVPIACPEPDQLDTAECAANEQTVVTALVTDVETSGALTSQQAAAVEVSVVEPAPDPDQGETAWTINPAEADDLRLVVGVTPTFADAIGHRFGGLICTLIRDPAPQSTTSIVCEDGPADVAMRDTHGILVPKATLDAILAALGGEFPPEGLLVGRVIGADGEPLAGVTVEPADGEVRYLSADRTSLIGATTSASGFFVSTDVPFGTAIEASHPDGRIAAGAPTAGLLRGQLTVVALRMIPP